MADEYSIASEDSRLLEQSTLEDLLPAKLEETPVKIELSESVNEPKSIDMSESIGTAESIDISEPVDIKTESVDEPSPTDAREPLEIADVQETDPTIVAPISEPQTRDENLVKLEEKFSSFILVEPETLPDVKIEPPETSDVIMIQNAELIKDESKHENEKPTEQQTITSDEIYENYELQKDEIPMEIEEISHVRRSRRLKSFYMDAPPPISAPVKVEENAINASGTLQPIVVDASAPSPELKVKTRWRKCAEMEQEAIKNEVDEPKTEDCFVETKVLSDEKFEVDQCDERLSHFVTIKDNIYIKESDRVICKVNKTMKCDCTITQQDLQKGELGCRYNCINRLLFIECSSKCRCGEYCDNQQFQRYNYSPCSVFRTERKGFGIRAEQDIEPETFIIEYVGEVLNNKQFEKRAKKYSKDKNRHYYFMALRSNAIIDATTKGNISRFINHSCDPCAMTQKWTVNGELRVGFFSTRRIEQGEEITFDYQFQRYGKEAQKCYCEATNCRGWIGENPMSDVEEDDEDALESPEVDESKKKTKTRKAAGSRKLKIKLEKSEPEQDNETAQDVSEEEEEEPQTLDDSKKPIKKRECIRKSVNKLTKRQEIFDDLEIEGEINDLTESGLKNRANTIRLSRLVVRAKNIEARSRLLEILLKGDLPCLRLFLDYNGLKLLHNWMCDVNVKSSIPDLYFCIELMKSFKKLPITNKTVLRESKVLERVEKWTALELTVKNMTKEERKQIRADRKKNKAAIKIQQAQSGGTEDVSVRMEVNEAADGPSEQSSAESIQPFDVPDELTFMKQRVKERATQLLKGWEILMEDFRIPKKKKQEIMIAHEREADLDNMYVEGSKDQLINDRYKNRFGDDPTQGGTNRPFTGPYKKNFDPAVSKQQRRQQFAMKVAQMDTEKLLIAAHEQNCQIFGLNPAYTSPINVPVRVNRVTGEYITIDHRIVPPPPNHHTFNYEKYLLSTNPEDYHLPPIDLPDQWKFAIDTSGRIYYYHAKIREPQWEAPIKILPLVESDGDDEPSSDESTTSTEDSEEEELIQTLRMLQRKKQLQTVPKLKLPTQTISDMPGNEDDELEKKIMNNMISNPLGQSSLKPSLTERKKKKKRRRGLSTMQFIRPRTEEDKIYGRTETKRYKEVKEKLRQDKKLRRSLGEAAGNGTDDEDDADLDDATSGSVARKIVDELDILHESKELDKMRKLKKDIDIGNSKSSPAGPSNVQSTATKLKKHKDIVVDQLLIKRQFRDEIKDEISKFLLPYRDESCENGRIESEDDFKSLINKV